MKLERGLTLAKKVALITILFLSIWKVINMKQENKKILRMVSAGAWFNIEPGLQHSLYADKVLSNQFEALVGTSDDGAIVPLAAKSWLISKDGLKIDFKIDTTRKFSDGSNLRSCDFKKSWEEALKKDPESTNSSLLDVLYKVSGYENFKDQGTFSGIKCPDDETLIVEFNSPFRFALDHFQGNRFAAFKVQPNGTFIGTGCYVLSAESDSFLRMFPNKYNTDCSDLNVIELSLQEPKTAIEGILSGNIDGIVYSFSSHYEVLPEDENLSVVSGYDANHEVILVNGGEGRIFSNPKYRLALQSIILRSLKSFNNAATSKNLLRIDPQVYLPLQGGRLNDENVDQLISLGEKYETEFLKYANNHPPVVKYSISRKWMVDLLSYAGIPFSETSKSISKEELRDLYYKSNDADLVPFGFSIVGVDPDNIYHALGKSGAITSKMLARKSIQELLEIGREITNLDLVNDHYEKVSEAIVSEVPFVHLGFSRHIAIFHNKRMVSKIDFHKRNQGHLNVYEAK